MNLSGQQYRKLQEALIDAFPDKPLLEQMLLFELGKNLNAFAGGDNLQAIVFQLIQTAKAQGWIEDLVRAAHEANPGNQNLQIVAQELLKGSTKPSIQQQKNQRDLVVPILVIVIGAISTITIAWNSKTQSPPTTSPVDVPIVETPPSRGIRRVVPEQSTSPTTSPIDVPIVEIPPSRRIRKVTPEQPRTYQILEQPTSPTDVPIVEIPPSRRIRKVAPEEPRTYQILR